MNIAIETCENDEVYDAVNLNLINSELDKLYQYTDVLTQKFIGKDKVTIRQVVNNNDLYLLSEARKIIYKKHASYFSQFYDKDYYIDEKDYSSYLFACYYQGEIIGTQRIATYPFEVSKFIEHEDLCQFLGDDYQDTYIEFSRLAVNSDYGLGKGVAHALNVVSGILVGMSINRSKYITYSKPQLKRQAANFGSDVITFTIKERENEQYELYKSDILMGLSQLLAIPKEPHLSLYDSIKNVMMNDKWS
ncbi:hypothetical protein [Shewanella surugensis]|uniref:GNAT family N-acetyltransferase n=1 Tax=Shewanella surugensis TaxID=212020 RepID=A0ABT0LGN3_9GAMM|nr:hypothetical protein [Shewanella surugensis]MCL1126872.1 hypothetical protein [Shewanella surugensis]